MAYKDENFKTLVGCTLDRRIKEAMKMAVKTMHSKGYVHCDFHDANILHYLRGAAIRSYLLTGVGRAKKGKPHIP